MYPIEKIVNLPSKLGVKQALNGKEILDAMVFIADEMEKDFENQDLNTLWTPFSGEYNNFMQPILEKHNLIEHIRKEDGYLMPFSGYPKQYIRPKKDFEYLSDILTFVDKQKFDSIDDKKEILGISYMVWYQLNNSSNYFGRTDVKDWLEERGVPKIFSGLASHTYAVKQRLKGRRDEKEILNQLYYRLSEKKINQNNPTINIMGRDIGEDIFVYNNHTIVIDKLPYKTKEQENYSFLNLVFASAIYNFNKEEKKEEILGYTILNNSEKIHKFFGIENHNVQKITGLIKY